MARAWQILAVVFIASTLFLLMRREPEVRTLTACTCPACPDAPAPVAPVAPVAVESRESSDKGLLALRDKLYVNLVKTRVIPATPIPRSDNTYIIHPEAKRAEHRIVMDLTRMMPKPMFIWPKYIVTHLSITDVELGIQAIVEWIMKDGACKRGGGKPDWLMLDVGANEGLYSMMAAGFGCRAIAVEPQTLCMMHMQISALLNNFDHLIDLRQNIVSAVPATLKITDGQCGTGSSYTRGEERDLHLEGWTSTEVSSITLDSLASEDVLLLHIDAEGAEPSIWESGPNLFSKHKVHNMIFENVPPRFAKWGITSERAAKLLFDLIQLQDWTCRVINPYPSLNSLKKLPVIDAASPQTIKKYMDSVPDAHDVWCTTMDVPEDAGRY